MKLQHITFLAGLIIALSSAAHGAGSFLLEDITPLLKQNKDIYDFLMGNLDLSKTGSAARIGQSVNPALGGTRLAPYVLFAKPKGGKDWTFEIHIEAKAEYFDASGKPTSFNTAISIRETFSSIRITPLQK